MVRIWRERGRGPSWKGRGWPTPLWRRRGCSLPAPTIHQRSRLLPALSGWGLLPGRGLLPWWLPIRLARRWWAGRWEEPRAGRTVTRGTLGRTT